METITYSFHRLVIEKVESFSVSMGIFGMFLKKCLLSSPLHFARLLSKSLILIGCQGHKKGIFS